MGYPLEAYFIGLVVAVSQQLAQMVTMFSPGQMGGDLVLIRIDNH